MSVLNLEATLTGAQRTLAAKVKTKVEQAARVYVPLECEPIYAEYPRKSAKSAPMRHPWD